VCVALATACQQDGENDTSDTTEEPEDEGADPEQEDGEVDDDEGFGCQ